MKINKLNELHLYCLKVHEATLFFIFSVNFFRVLLEIANVSGKAIIWIIFDVSVEFSAH